MTWQIVRLADTAPSPWRNGGGVTRELVAWPDTPDWLWRMSVAEVAQGGPFSRFEGVQRWFAVLAGAGVRLTVGEVIHELTDASAPLCFDGATPVDCQLLEGATQDFNLMVRSKHGAGRMKRIAEDTSFVLDAPKIIAVYAMNTRATVLIDHKNVLIPAHSLAWSALPAGATVQLNTTSALWMEINA